MSLLGMIGDSRANSATGMIGDVWSGVKRECECECESEGRRQSECESESEGKRETGKPDT